MLSSKTITISLSTVVILALVNACSPGEVSNVPASTDPYPNGRTPGAGCEIGADCRSGVCTRSTCQSATSSDGVRNGDETDVDCGGSAGPRCSSGKACATDSDCASGVCAGFKCGEPTPSEPPPPAITGCGGPGELPRCADGETCTEASDCASATCHSGTCRPAHQYDGIENEGETDIDCGGPHPDKCATDKDCSRNADCQSVICDVLLKTCRAPAFDDNVKNGLETDVDCGGPDAPRRCAAGQGCKVHSDCETDGCTYENKCAVGASCTNLEGGQTCGPNESLEKQNDCCERARVGAYSIDKYLVTAGRMRTFLTRLDGKVRDWAATLPAAKWNQAWTAMLPNSIDGPPGNGGNANTQLGPYFGKRACETGWHTGHTFWTPPLYGDVKDFPQNVLDMKALNCVPWWLLAALCVFDGGHLLTEPELRAAYTNNGTTVYPWGARGTYMTSLPNDYGIGLWSYDTPNPPPGAGRDMDGFTDAAFYVGPPGRRPLGYNATGHADLVGNLLEWVGDSERQFVWKGSFDNHAREADLLEPPLDDDPYLVMRTPAIPWRWNDVVAMGSDPQNVNGYYAIGGRCGY